MAGRLRFEWTQVGEPCFKFGSLFAKQAHFKQRVYRSRLADHDVMEVTWTGVLNDVLE